MARPRGSRTIRPPVPTEHEECVKFTQVARLICAHKKLPPPFHIGNETKASHGFALVRYLAAAGTEPGIPDYFFAVARGGFHGLWIEMKRQKHSRMTASQRLWGILLREQGYMVIVAHGADRALERFNEYLAMEDGKNERQGGVGGLSVFQDNARDAAGDAGDSGQRGRRD